MAGNMAYSSGILRALNQGQLQTEADSCIHPRHSTKLPPDLYEASRHAVHHFQIAAALKVLAEK
eukprot:1159977-Pelagomonas_calceolata.AAC.5